jgi:hypothetical protein
VTTCTPATTDPSSARLFASVAPLVKHTDEAATASTSAIVRRAPSRTASSRAGRSGCPRAATWSR